MTFLQAPITDGLPRPKLPKSIKHACDVLVSNRRKQRFVAQGRKQHARLLGRNNVKGVSQYCFHSWVVIHGGYLLERREAEERQRMKALNKKAQAAASQRSAEQKARAQQEHLQMLRSDVFTAARRGDIEKVKKGIWEQNVDASGGEIRTGAEALVKSRPQDPQETLMHIAAKNGDAELVEWLDSHSWYFTVPRSCIC